MNGYIVNDCIDMRNDTLHANIITTCLRQYLLGYRDGTIFLTTLAAHLGSRCMLCGMLLTNQLVHKNHPTELKPPRAWSYSLSGLSVRCCFSRSRSSRIREPLFE